MTISEFFNIAEKHRLSGNTEIRLMNGRSGYGFNSVDFKFSFYEMPTNIEGVHGLVILQPEYDLDGLPAILH